MQLRQRILPFIFIMSRGNKIVQSTKVFIRMGALMVINYDVKEWLLFMPFQQKIQKHSRSSRTQQFVYAVSIE